MKTNKKETICLNCGNRFVGNFCPCCGQNARTKRLMFGEMLSHFLDSFVGGDNVFLRTSYDLLCRPGDMQRDYLLGKRIRYKNPLQMFIYLITLYAIISYVTGLSSFLFDNLESLDFDLTDTKDSPTVEVISKYLKVIYTNKLYGTFFTAFIEVISFCLVFRTKILRPDGAMLPLSLTEQFFVQMYHSCTEMFFTIALLPLALIDRTISISHYTYDFLAFLYSVIIFKKLLGIGWIKSTLLNIVAMFLSFVLIVLLLFLATKMAIAIDKLM